MKLNWQTMLVAATMLVVCGCKHYDFRMTQPPGYPQPLGRGMTTVHYEPLDYQVARRDDHVAIQVVNPTDTAVTLVANKSYVVDPQQESHPIHGAAIAPHSHINFMLPPVPLTYTAYGYLPYAGYAPYWYHGYAWGPYGGFPFGLYNYGPLIEPYSYSYQVLTPYNWRWKEGPVRLHLDYQSTGTNFAHDFVFVRERTK